MTTACTLKSKWHTLGFQDRYEAVREFCYKPGYNLPEYAEGITKGELRGCLIALFRAEEKVRHPEGDEAAYYKAWQEEEGKLRGTIKRLD